MDSCFAFGDRETSVNKSWICLKHNGSVASDCFFLLEQQLDRPSESCGSIEAALIITLCLACYPANVIAVRNYAKQQLKREFVLLITVVAFCNVCLASIGILQGIARSTDDWIFGIYGCAATIPGPGFFTTLKLWTMTVISFERYLAISHSKEGESCHQQQNNSNNPPSRFGSFLSIIALLLILNCSVWIYPFNYIEIVQIYLPRTRSGDHVRLINVCGLMTFKMPASESLTKCLFAVATFCIPVIVGFGNYIRIGVTMYKEQFMQVLIRKTPSSGSHQLSHSSSSSSSCVTIVPPPKPHCAKYRQEVYLTTLHMLSLVEFFLCALPSQIANGYIRFDNDPQRRTMQSFVLFAAHCLLLINAITNPLIGSVFTKKRTVSKKGAPTHRRPRRLSCHEMTEYLDQKKKEAELLYEDLSNQSSNYFIDSDNSAPSSAMLKKIVVKSSS